MSTKEIIINSSAKLSADDKYRYWLHQRWNADGKIGMFICINPSTADALMTDITMCNCRALAVIWGWGGFYITNLYGYRATNQNDLTNCDYPIGSENDKYIRELSEQVDCIVLAWGNRYKDRQEEVMKLIDRNKLYCIDKNKGGGYLHPSRIKPFNYKEPKKITTIEEGD